MRADLRATCSEIWVVDCSPEGHQPNVATRIFQGVQQPVCIVLAARKLAKSTDKPALVRFHVLPKGSRPIIGDRRPPAPLDKIQPDHWLPEYTSDLLDLLNVLGRLIALQPRQADLLDRICAGRLQSAEELHEAGALARVDETPAATKHKSKSKA
jgi:hypothetical protein